MRNGYCAGSLTADAKVRRFYDLNLKNKCKFARAKQVGEYS